MEVAPPSPKSLGFCGLEITVTSDVSGLVVSLQKKNKLVMAEIFFLLLLSRIQNLLFVLISSREQTTSGVNGSFLFFPRPTSPNE